MKTNSLSAWILAVRPYSLGNSVILVLIGSALAWTDRGFHWLPAVLCLAFALLMQCTANLVNDLWDFLKGADQPDRLGPDRAFAKGYSTLGAMKAGIAGFTLAACAAGVALLVWALHAGALRYGGWELVAAGVACIVFAWFYTAGPYPLAYHGLGDAAVILFFGLVPVGFTYYIQTGAWTPEVLVAALACGLTLLFAGRTWAALLPLPYLAAHISTWRKMVRIDHGDALNVCLGETARNILLFGALFTLGILLGR